MSRKWCFRDEEDDRHRAEEEGVEKKRLVGVECDCKQNGTNIKQEINRVA